MLLIPKAAREIVQDVQSRAKYIRVSFSTTAEACVLSNECGHVVTLVPVTISRQYAFSEDRQKAVEGHLVAPVIGRRLYESDEDTLANWLKTYDIEENKGLGVVFGIFGMISEPTAVQVYVGFVEF